MFLMLRPEFEANLAMVPQGIPQWATASRLIVCSPIWTVDPVIAAVSNSAAAATLWVANSRVRRLPMPRTSSYCPGSGELCCDRGKQHLGEGASQQSVRAKMLSSAQPAPLLLEDSLYFSG
ncbi:MAG: hypothetical protein P4L92_01155 [Rudaea sp.]|nr:hypothetical protein [Rudaea sp.]